MCLGIPAKIIRVDGDTGLASIQGATLEVGLQLLDEVQPGDYVLIHTGYALEKISQEEAQKTLALLEEINSGSPPADFEE